MADDSCIFCRIARGEIPADVVHEGGAFLAFRDINPKAPVHILIVPRRHIRAACDLEPQDCDLMGRMILAARIIASDEGVEASGFRLVINTGSDAGQSVDHLHIHLMGGRSMSWPPG
ncbi:MAG: histidine triad nucleotide-binding protein [Gemmatimonadetes bacterium]|nr:histidine triad nucleotide-binding protein [Gemmatimonadota bacterium]